MNISGVSDFQLPRTSLIRVTLLALIWIFAFNHPVAKAQQAASTPAAKSAAKPFTAAQMGARKFRANCSRCHTAPEQISPRIAGTVLRHMRVRASLSAEDEQQILRYMTQ